MTLLTVTAAVSTGFAYDYVSNNNANNTNYVTSNNDNQYYCGPNSNCRGCCGYRR